MPAYSVISEIIDNELEEHKKSAACEDEDSAGLRSVFLNILELKDLDIRDKKSAIIDFIAAGIETVSDSLSLLLSISLPTISQSFSHSLFHSLEGGECSFIIAIHNNYSLNSISS